MSRNTEILLSRAADALLNCRPRRKPSHARLNEVRIVSHRGEHDNVNVRENTTAAFDAALDAGVWGLEFDVRFTADGEPVVIHDADLQRVFGQPTVVAETPWSTLRDRAPQVSHLETFLANYAQRAHLMLELKARAPGIGEARLLRLLETLEPAADFHVLALDPALFPAARELPARCRLPVAKFNTRAMLEYALTHECAGLAGSYMLMQQEHIQELQAAGRRVGSGFVASRAVLWREVSRGAHWIFSNHAAQLQQLLDNPHEH